MFVMLFRLAYHREERGVGGREGMSVAVFVTCKYHIAKHRNPLEDWFPGEMENFGGGGEEKRVQS